MWVHMGTRKQGRAESARLLCAAHVMFRCLSCMPPHLQLPVQLSLSNTWLHRTSAHPTTLKQPPASGQLHPANKSSVCKPRPNQSITPPAHTAELLPGRWTHHAWHTHGTAHVAHATVGMCTTGTHWQGCRQALDVAIGMARAWLASTSQTTHDNRAHAPHAPPARTAGLPPGAGCCHRHGGLLLQAHR
jgi:hypothetical protein